LNKQTIKSVKKISHAAQVSATQASLLWSDFSLRWALNGLYAVIFLSFSLLFASKLMAEPLASKPLAKDSTPLKLLVLGDSLSAEYGLARGKGWVALLEAQLQRDGIQAQVVNASISGETTSGGKSRLAALLKTHQPSHVVIELGANDALRGLALTDTEKNLNDMIALAKSQRAQVLLVGMQVPPNYGADYTKQFAAVFVRVAQQSKTPLVPFLLKGVADRPDAANWFQADRIHPTEQAHPQMLANVWAGLKPLLKSAASKNLSPMSKTKSVANPAAQTQP
jgi:acyl-CoA thioesterase I